MSQHISGLAPSMRRVVSVLEATPRPLRVQEIADRTHLSLNGARYCIENLVRTGVVKQAGECLNHTRLARLYVRGEAPVASVVCGLWPKDVEVLQCLANGKTWKEIGAILGRGHSSLSVACTRIYDTLGACNAAGAVAVGFRRGLIK